MKKYDTIIFDLDGTLLDTLEDLADSVNYVLKQNGFPTRTKEEIRKFLGNGLANLMELSVPGGRSNPQYEKCIADFREYYAQNMYNKTAPYEGVLELLEQLSKMGYKMAVVSNKFDKAVKTLCKTYFSNYIKVAIGESAHIAKKPAPDTVLKAIKILDSSADKIVYVGDSEVDVKTAKNTGVICVGVTWGFRDRTVLEKEGADFIMDKPDELLNIIN